MTDIEKVLRGTEICLSGGLPERCSDCPYHNAGCDHQRMKDTLVLINELVDGIEKMKTKCREMNREIRELKAKNITASGNGIAVGEIRGGLVIQRQEAKEIHNIKHVEVFNA